MKEFDLNQLKYYDPEYLIKLGFDYTDFIVLSNHERESTKPWGESRPNEVCQWFSNKYPLIKFTYDQ